MSTTRVNLSAASCYAHSECLGFNFNNDAGSDSPDPFVVFKSSNGYEAAVELEFFSKI